MSDEIDDKDGDQAVIPQTKTVVADPVPDDDEEKRNLRKALKKANAEAQANREAKRRLQELEEEANRRKQEEMPEIERLQKRIAESERLIKEREEEARKNRDELLRVRRDREAEDEARKIGADPKATALMLRGMDNPDIDYDAESDRFNGIQAAVKKLVASFPALLESGGLQRGRGTPPRERVAEQRGQHSQASQLDVDKAGLTNRIHYTGF